MGQGIIASGGRPGRIFGEPGRTFWSSRPGSGKTTHILPKWLAAGSREGRNASYNDPPGDLRPSWIPSGTFVQPGPTFVAASPRVVFQGRYVGGFGRNYDVSPDGQRFLMIKDARPADERAASQQLVVVLNWLQELKRLVPTK